MRISGIKSEVYVYVIPLNGIPEIVRQNRDGSFTILVDECLTRDQQTRMVEHALCHIRCEADWYPGQDVNTIEVRAHGEEEK